MWPSDPDPEINALKKFLVWAPLLVGGVLLTLTILNV